MNDADLTISCRRAASVLQPVSGIVRRPQASLHFLQSAILRGDIHLLRTTLLVASALASALAMTAGAQTPSEPAAPQPAAEPAAVATAAPAADPAPAAPAETKDA